MRNGRRAPRPAPGFTYLVLLFVLAAMGLVAAGAAEVWETAVKRERERELLFIGHQYRDAIGRYYERSPTVKQYPQRLDELLQDKRFPQVVRHLRKRYRDPVTGGSEWGLVLEQGRIVGIHSLSRDAPLKRGNFETADFDLVARATYAEWRFIYHSGADPVSSGKAGAPMLEPLAPAADEQDDLQREALDILPDPRIAGCAAEYVAALRRCAPAAGDSQACFTTAVEARNACLGRGAPSQG